MIAFKNRLKETIYERLKNVYPVTIEDLDMAPTPDPKMGDLALTFPFQLAKSLKKAPRVIAQEAAPLLGSVEGVVKAEVAGGGFLNLWLDKAAVFAEAIRTAGRTSLVPEEDKVIIEHTNINPNKAAHIGHLRNACLGDTLARCLRFKGEKVEVQNYIDDTGVQVVDVVFGLLELEKKTLAEVEAIPGKFDYYCWDLYARTAAYLETDPAAQARKAEMLKRIEHGAGPEGAMAHYVSRRILHAHLATMKRIGASYDVLPCESSIIGLKFWDKAFALLKEKKGIYFVEDGPNAGCWVMKLEDGEDKEKIIVRSNGTVTYVGKDIAYQMWKFGLLDRDFYYEPFLEEEGRTIWISTAVPNESGRHFGGATRVYNVIDTRQSYLQKVVVQGLRALQFDAQADKSVHFSYEMVALSPRSMKELGATIAAEDADKAFHEVSGRKGLGVKADDLLDRLEDKAFAEVDKRNADLSPESKRRTAREIARGSLRYFMLKFARNSLLIFDFDDALSFEGETGPYLQYTCVRLNSIFRKLEEREGTTAEAVDRLVRAANAPSLGLLPEAERNDAWELLTFSAQFDDEALRSIESLEFSHAAKFAFALAQKCNGYYHKYPILSESEADLKTIRILVVAVVRDVLARALDLMGIPVPERM